MGIGGGGAALVVAAGDAVGGGAVRQAAAVAVIPRPWPKAPPCVLRKVVTRVVVMGARLKESVLRASTGIVVGTGVVAGTGVAAKRADDAVDRDPVVVRTIRRPRRNQRSSRRGG
jgi:hypothetical protein